jgi:hypothetical protein
VDASQVEVLRVSSPDTHVQGEVKFSTGTNGNPDLGTHWIEAGVNLPIGDGATLATEEGRAQVEFENGSVAYLAEHSVLQLKGLKNTAQGTNTTMALLTGTASFAHESNGKDDLTIETLAADLHMKSAMVLRVESAVDGAVFRIVEGTLEISVGATGQAVQVGPGQAVQCVGGVVSRVEEAEGDMELKNWDQWVSVERAARKADIEKGLKESGLKAPIPGLVDLVRTGTFSDCAPYGKCWEPNVEAQAANESGEAKATAGAQAQSPGRQGATATNTGASQTANAQYVTVTEPAGAFLFLQRTMLDGVRGLLPGENAADYTSESEGESGEIGMAKQRNKLHHGFVAMGDVSCRKLGAGLARTSLQAGRAE